MKSIVLLMLVLASAASSAESAPAKKPSPAKQQPAHLIVDPTDPQARERPASSFLPDSFEIARVADRRITVHDFRDLYYISAADLRPRSDSAGRVEFLSTLIDKEVMGLTAVEANHPLTFDDRLVMRRHINTVLQNVLYKRMVVDSIEHTPEEIESKLQQFAIEQRLRSILFRDRQTAERTRRELVSGRLSWNVAAARQAPHSTAFATGDMGWVQRHKVRGAFALEAFALKPGAISGVIQDADGYRIVQCLEQRQVPMVRSFAVPMIMQDLRTVKAAPLVARMNTRIRGFAGVVYDSTNIDWVAGRFREAFERRGTRPAGSEDLYSAVPSFAPADTGRILARTSKRTITLGQFTDQYLSIPALTRAEIGNLESFILAFDGPALEAERIEYARSLGLENDPFAKELIDKQREKILVEHLYQDSVLNRLNVTPDMRLAYYKANLSKYVAIPLVRYARFLRPNLEAAEALMARLRAGTSAAAIMHEDSLRGDDTTGTIREILQTEPDEHKKIVFEELRPGQITKVGPDLTGQYLVLQTILYDPERQMNYEEVRSIVDESVENVEAERLLKALVARRRAHYEVHSRPDQVMNILLIDPNRPPQ